MKIKKKMMRTALSAALLSICILFSGCTGIFDEDSSSSEGYDDTYCEEDEDLTGGCDLSGPLYTENMHYEWDYGGQRWTYDLEIPVDTVEMYRAMERDPSAYGDLYASYVSHDADDQYIGDMTDTFVDAALDEGWSEDDAVHLAVSFVQSLEYIPEDETSTTDYPKYPLETLYDRGGDCEDSSILLISLLKEMGYGTCLIGFDDHMAVGILGESGMTGQYFQKDGKRYFYIETTCPGWEIGQIPEAYEGKKARLWVF